MDARLFGLNCQESLGKGLRFRCVVSVMSWICLNNLDLSSQSQGQKPRRGGEAAVGEEKPHLPRPLVADAARLGQVPVKRSATQERAGVPEQLARG